ncbi:MAG: MoaD/ThiS family protein [Thermoanaerobaculia bacterium]
MLPSERCASACSPSLPPPTHWVATRRRSSSPTARMSPRSGRPGERFPSLASVLPRAAIAVDGEIGAADRPLAGATEVAILPPVSGG